MSRLRGSSSIKEGSKVSSFSTDRFHDEQPDRVLKSCNSNSNRYHFGMTRQPNDEVSKNGRGDYKEHVNANADLLYKKSKEHFGAWDIKDIVQDGSVGSRKQTADRFEGNNNTRLINGRSRGDHDDREETSRARTRTGSIDREQDGPPHESRRKENWENSKLSRSKRDDNDDDDDDDGAGGQRNDGREQLLREIENLAIDGRSPDRKIRAMIDRFKSRENRDRLKFPIERSPEKKEEECGGKSEGRVDRVAIEPKSRDHEKYEQEDNGRNRSADRRTEKSNDAFTERKHRRPNREADDFGVSRRRRSYANDSNPEDFDVRIQRYERAVVEPRRDLESSRRVSLKDSAADLGRKDSLKDHDRQVTRKSSFEVSGDTRRSHSRDRESSLSRKTSLKSQENDPYRKNSFRSEDALENKYFGGRDTKHVSRKSSSKEQGYDLGRKNSFKEQNSDYGRILPRNRDDTEQERKRSLKGTHADGVSRITFKEQDFDSTGSYRDQEADVGLKVGFKDRSGDSARRNSFKEKTVEFGGISWREDRDDDDDNDDDDDADRRITTKAYKVRDDDPSKASSRNLAEPRRRHSPNGRYVEFGSGVVCFRSQGDEEAQTRSPPNDRDHDSEKMGCSFEERDPLSSKRRRSPRGKNQEAVEKRSNRHSRPLTPPRREQPRIECREDTSNGREPEFDSKSWHESNRIFAARYFRENSSKYRANPDGRSEIDRDPSPETRVLVRDSDGGGFGFGFGSSTGIDGSRRGRAKLETGEPNRERDWESRCTSTTHERNGATIIRIRTSPETPVERRRRRRPLQDTHAGRRTRRYEAEDEADSDEEDEEEEEKQEERKDRRQRGSSRREDRDGFLPSGRGVSTPSRRVWNYREGGVLITDVEEGQPCLQCGDTCSGFSPHTWRKNCTSCKCPREAHDVCHEEWASVRSRLGLKGEESSHTIVFDPRAKGLAWAPPGLPAHKVEEYFSMLPEISVPRLGTPGERYRDRQLAIQLPKQDLATAYCRHLNPKHVNSADDFMTARNEIALDIGSVQEILETDVNCGACDALLPYGSLVVSASKLDLFYHPACFRCTECKELLVDLAYCVHDNTLFCERHYAEQLKPRCAACDELIFSGEYTKAMNKDWHSGHFCCWQCDESLTGQRYVLRDEHPYCIKCYESVFANGCEECNKIIGIDSKDLSYKDKHWHEACFLCNRCRVSLVDKQFGSKVDKIYCGNCYDAQFASRCDGCGEIFRAGTKKMEYKTRQWHEKCFCCVVCKNPIGTKSFIPREQEIYCAACYEDKFATRCVKCNKIITSGGVTYKNEPWHRDCFTCSNCNNSLAGQRFTSRNDKPYCAECFGELFAKRCTACSKPITGIGGTRFISFEDRHWHNDCFICAGCKTSLVGRGFITDGEDIICPDCAKMKVM